jgi:hypothetical protein
MVEVLLTGSSRGTRDLDGLDDRAAAGTLA